MIAKYYMFLKHYIIFKWRIDMRGDHHRLLRALRQNALFSGASALLMFLTGGWIAAQMGLSSAVPVYVTAAVLVVFSAQLGQIVRTRRIRSWEIAGIIGGDLTWVIASAILVAVFFDSLTIAGLLLVDLVALAVLFFAIQQLRGLRALSRPA